MSLVKYKNRLKGVHPDLQKVVAEFEKTGTVSVTVSAGLRTKELQKKYVAEGKSKTMNSRHLTGHAIDVLPIDSKGALIDSWVVYQKMAKEMKAAAVKLGVKITWGGDWTRFRDGPHFELNRYKYPANSSVVTANSLGFFGAETVLSSAVKKIASTLIAALSFTLSESDTVVSTVERYSESFMSGNTIKVALATLAVAGALYVSYKSYTDYSNHKAY
jgi:peptidoglycan L-alanyl-D-glutamate endopeptidase CwlK